MKSCSTLSGRESSLFIGAPAGCVLFNRILPEKPLHDTLSNALQRFLKRGLGMTVG